MSAIRSTTTDLSGSRVSFVLLIWLTVCTAPVLAQFGTPRKLPPQEVENQYAVPRPAVQNSADSTSPSSLPGRVVTFGENSPFARELPSTPQTLGLPGRRVQFFESGTLGQNVEGVSHPSPSHPSHPQEVVWQKRPVPVGRLTGLNPHRAEAKQAAQVPARIPAQIAVSSAAAPKPAQPRTVHFLNINRAFTPRAPEPSPASPWQPRERLRVAKVDSRIALDPSDSILESVPPEVRPDVPPDVQLEVRPDVQLDVPGREESAVSSAVEPAEDGFLYPDSPETPETSDPQDNVTSEAALEATSERTPVAADVTNQSEESAPSPALSPTSPASLEARVEEQFDLERLGGQILAGRIAQERPAVSINLQSLLALTLAHSKNVQVLQIQPAEVQQDVQAAYGRFDWTGFVNSVFAQDAQPNGNLLQTNMLNIPQVRNDRNAVGFGVRKQTLSGGTLEFQELLGTRDTNSGLLNPEQPGTAQLGVTFSQELLRGRGREVVLSQALIASLAADQTHARSFAEISNLLRNVIAQYWELYERRAEFFIQLSLVQWTEETIQLLESRSDVETNSMAQAQALLEEAKASLITARAKVLIAQDRLFRLVNAPEIDANHFELLTVESPTPVRQSYGLDSELQQALAFRAEITQKLTEIRAAAIAHHVSLNQLLPRLTLSIASSLNGLDENRDFWGAKRNISDIDPSYAANVNFEIRLGNRTARAQNKQAQIALRRLQLEYEDQIQQVRLDVASALRTLNASTEILRQRERALQSREIEIEYLTVRRDVIPQQGSSTTLLLEQLFQAISRRVASERAYLAAIADQQLAMADLLQAKGVLVSVNQIPRDFCVEVPSLSEARKQAKQLRPELIQETRSRVIAPGR